LGEGAAYLVLMSEDALTHFQAEPLAVLSGWGNANDAFHQTASSAEGTGNGLAIQAALDRAGLKPSDISYINLHGTGTANNDSSEGKAIERIFSEVVPPCSSTKAYTGHTLGAAGAVEAVFSVMGIQEGLIFPNHSLAASNAGIKLHTAADSSERSTEACPIEFFWIWRSLYLFNILGMLNLDCYVHAAAWIAPDENADASKGWRSADTGDLSTHIPLMQLRRMSKIVRMGMACAIACKIKRPEIFPDAIAVGTAWGCIQDTEHFLKKIVTQDEQMLTPTAFIQSTHNTVAGQIALLMDCKGYNNTLSQGGHSFESAVLGSVLYLNEHPDHSILCGGVDELNETAFQWMKRAGLYPGESMQPKAGEGAGFLLLNKNSKDAKACIRGLHLFSNDLKKARVELREIFERNPTRSLRISSGWAFRRILK
jgi:3-oxoacyl-(acyl-carrier-protein) synthase